jgi:anti-sigma regulatory factor (Ser/Thr protein kinase)
MKASPRKSKSGNSDMLAPPRIVETVQFRLSSDPKLLKIIRAGIAHLCELGGFSPEQCNQTIIAVDEACSNIIRYAYDGKTDQLMIITACLLENGIQIMLRDFGKKADEDFIKPRDLDDIRPGGLGVHLIRSTMDSVSYANLEHGNRLTLTKYNRSVHAGNRDA